MQNCAAHLMTGTWKGEHIMPVLFQLYWLPVCFRSLYKILFLNGTAPLYLRNLIQNEIPVRSLQSESYSLLTVSKNTHSNVRRNFSQHPLTDCVIRCQIILNLQQEIFCKVLKPSLFIIYKPVYLCINVFVLHELEYVLIMF